MTGMPPTAVLLVSLLLAAPVVAGCSAAPAEPAATAVRPTVPGGIPVPGAAQVVEVTRHVDGDTLRVRAAGLGVLPEGREVVVRLLEVDAPETKAGPECFGEQAAAELARLLPLGSRASVVPDREPLDRYGRHLLYVWDAQGRSVNELLVQRGLATAVLYEPNDRHIVWLRRVEAEARERGRGLWGACSDVSP